MKFHGNVHRRAQDAFTLAEVLAALVFMAIVVPVALGGLNVASRAGEVAVRKAEAALVAERLLTESTVTTNWNQSLQTGNVRQGIREFRYTLKSEPWAEDPSQSDMRLLSVEVVYMTQGGENSVKLSTLVDDYTPFAETNLNY